MDLMNEFRQMLLNEIRKFSPDYPSDEVFDVLLYKFLNLHDKLIDIHKREVYKSKVLCEKPLTSEYQAAMDLIEKKIINGEDVNCHLSRLAQDPGYHDLLMSDWAIHHFHLSTTKRNPNDYLFKRSNQLLFARVTEKAAYFIDVLNHDLDAVFARKQLLEIIHDEWPFLLERCELKGFLPGIPSMSDEELKRMRETGINVIQEMDGRLFMSMGGGITAGGTNMYNQMTSTRIKKWLANVEKLVMEKPDQIKTMVKSNKDTELESLELKAMYIKHHFLIFEPNTKTILFDFPLPVYNI